MENKWQQRRLWQKNQLVCLTWFEWSIKKVCQIHFPCMVFTGAFSEEQRAYIALFADEKDVSVKQISQKTGISPTTIRPTNNKWNFCWIFRARDPSTLNNFPIAEIFNGQALGMNKSIKWIEIKWKKQKHQMDQISCTPTVLLLYPSCTPTVPFLYPYCTLPVPFLYPSCTYPTSTPHRPHIDPKWTFKKSDGNSKGA